MMTGTLGDMAGNQYERGRVSAIVGLFSAFGGMVAGLALVKLPDQLGKKLHDEYRGHQLSFTIVGGCALALALILFLILPKTGAGAADGLTAWFKNCFSCGKDNTLDKQTSETLNPWKMLKYGVLAARDPRIGLAYLSSFVVSCH